MLTTPHVLVGLYLATHLPPTLALPLALIAHFIFDYFYPHWNPHLYTEKKNLGRLSTNTLKIIVADGILALSLLAFVILWNHNSLQQIIVLMMAAFLSVLPDLMEIPYYFLGKKTNFWKAIINFEHKYQARANFTWGVLSQILVIVVCLWQIII